MEAVLAAIGNHPWAFIGLALAGVAIVAAARGERP